MTFAWQEHGGDRVGVRINFTPPLAEIVPMAIEIVLPLADQADTDFGNVVLSGRLPLFYWRINDGEVQPLQRGLNNVNLPAGMIKLELGVYRNTQNQILNDEYVYKEEVSSIPILKTVIFKLRVPEGNINLPRFGERDYTVDVTRLNTRKPSVISSIIQSDAVVNAEVSRKEIVVRFNEPTINPLYFTFMDAMNELINADSPTRLASVGVPAGVVKIGVLNNPNPQRVTPTFLAPSYQSGFLLYSTAEGSDFWFSCVNEPYPISGNQLGTSSFLIPVGTRSVKWQHTYNRTAMNDAIVTSGQPMAWERVFMHLSKKWESGAESGRHYRDSRTEIVEITYPNV